MRDSHFGTPNGWMDEGRTFTTARDLATLADAMLTRHPDLYARYFGHERLRFNGFEQRNHDPVTGVVEGAGTARTARAGAEQDPPEGPRPVPRARRRARLRRRHRRDRLLGPVPRLRRLLHRRKDVMTDDTTPPDQSITESPLLTM